MLRWGGFRVSHVMAQLRSRSRVLRALGMSPDANARMGSRWPARLASICSLIRLVPVPELPIHPSATSCANVVLSRYLGTVRYENLTAPRSPRHGVSGSTWV